MIAPDESAAAAPRRPVKSETAFRTISEVSEDLEVPQHVLRFWESKFSQIKPLKRGGGRRYYRPEDLQLLKHIRDLLYKDGYTIKGVQKLLRDEAKGPAAGKPEDEAGEPAPVAEPVVEAVREVASPPAQDEDPRRAALRAIHDELLSLREMLRQAREV